MTDPIPEKFRLLQPHEIIQAGDEAGLPSGEWREVDETVEGRTVGSFSVITQWRRREAEKPKHAETL